MALTNAQKNRLFVYLMRAFNDIPLQTIIAALYDALFLTKQGQEDFLRTRLLQARARTQTLRTNVDAEAVTTKTTLDAELADIDTISVGLDF